MKIRGKKERREKEGGWNGGQEGGGVASITVLLYSEISKNLFTLKTGKETFLFAQSVIEVHLYQTELHEEGSFVS